MNCWATASEQVEVSQARSRVALTCSLTSEGKLESVRLMALRSSASNSASSAAGTVVSMTGRMLAYG